MNMSRLAMLLREGEKTKKELEGKIEEEVRVSRNEATAFPNLNAHHLPTTACVSLLLPTSLSPLTQCKNPFPSQLLSLDAG